MREYTIENTKQVCEAMNQMIAMFQQQEFIVVIEDKSFVLMPNSNLDSIYQQRMLNEWDES